jgi:hypothetical protein
MWTIWLACAPAPPAATDWPAPADDAAAVRLAGARTYLDLLAGSTGDPPAPLTPRLGACAHTLRAGGDDPPCAALLSAWILDAEVRRARRGARALRDVVAAAPDPVDVAGWHAAAAEVAGRPLPAWSAQDLAGGSPDCGAALDWFGLAWDDGPDGVRGLRAHPGASPQARQRRARWAR